MKEVKELIIGFLGLGTVGSGALNILGKNTQEILERMGYPIRVKSILVRNLDKPRAADVSGITLTDDPAVVLDDPEIDVIIELIGGCDPAKEYILKAFNNGKHVVSANKELIAKHGGELFEAAGRNGCDFFFEGSVAGGIPIIRALKECLTANRINSLMGIINGTTNYILTRMTNEGCDFQDVLKEAQAKGYAEADPTADVDGFDATYKLAIMASIAFGSRVSVPQVHCEGIRNITPFDIELAEEMGYRIKLLAIAKNLKDGIELRVHPTLIPLSHPLATVNDVFNAIHIKGNAVGDLMFYGRGAGDYPTGSSVVADIIDIGRNIRYGSTGRIGCTCQGGRDVKKMDDTVTQYYVRFSVLDSPGVLSKIATEFGRNGVSIASVIQKGRSSDLVPLTFITHEVREANFMTAMESIRKYPEVGEVANVLRVENGQTKM